VSETRPYDAERDLEAVTRIWREIAWIDSEDEAAKALETFMAAGNVNVGTIDGEAECSVHWTPGTMHHLVEPVPLCAITAVTTSRIGRKKGFASTLTAMALAEGADSGAAVAALGMFEQGFYNRLGFATGAYDHMYRLDPRALRIETPTGRPSACRRTTGVTSTRPWWAGRRPMEP
jgi:predicted acetyltransferase